MIRALVTAALCAPMAETVMVPAISQQDQSVVTYHGHADRSRHYGVPGLTWDRARTVHLDPRFHGEVAGHGYAQPLYWQPAASGPTPALLIVATEDACDPLWACSRQLEAFAAVICQSRCLHAPSRWLARPTP